MKIMNILIGFASILAAGAVRAADCPFQVGEDFLINVSLAAGGAKSCHAAVELVRACMPLDTSKRSPLVSISARARCVLDFKDKLSNEDRTIHKGLLEKCDKKYAKLTESVAGLKAALLCELQVDELFSELYTPADEQSISP